MTGIAFCAAIFAVEMLSNELRNGMFMFRSSALRKTQQLR
jgi:hypothetical protein